MWPWLPSKRKQKQKRNDRGTWGRSYFPFNSDKGSPISVLDFSAIASCVPWHDFSDWSLFVVRVPLNKLKLLLIQGDLSPASYLGIVPLVWYRGISFGGDTASFCPTFIRLFSILSDSQQPTRIIVLRLRFSRRLRHRFLGLGSCFNWIPGTALPTCMHLTINIIASYLGGT